MDKELELLQDTLDMLILKAVLAVEVAVRLSQCGFGIGQTVDDLLLRV